MSRKPDPDHSLIDRDGCGRPTPADLIDAKPPPGEDPETADFTVLQCQRCYGPGWRPLGRPTLWQRVRMALVGDWRAALTL